MKINELLELKCDEENEVNLDVLRNAVLKTEWFSKFTKEELNLKILEKGFRKITKKYPGYIGFVAFSSENSWMLVLRNSEDFEVIKSIYCCYLEEGLLKTIMVFYAHFIKGIKFDYVGKK